MDPLSSREEFPLAASAAGLAGGYLPSAGTQPPAEREELGSSDKKLLRGHFWLAALLPSAQPEVKADLAVKYL